MGIDRPTGHEEPSREVQSLQSIPPDVIGRKVCFFTKKGDPEKGLGGVVRGGRIEVGKSIVTGGGHTSEVVAIEQVGPIFEITTQNSVYLFDPAESVDQPNGQAAGK